jgi:hypothetical protein
VSLSGQKRWRLYGCHCTYFPNTLAGRHQHNTGLGPQYYKIGSRALPILTANRARRRTLAVLAYGLSDFHLTTAVGVGLTSGGTTDGVAAFRMGLCQKCSPRYSSTAVLHYILQAIL